MNTRTFRSELERALLSIGFERAGKSLVRYDSKVWTLVGLEKGFGNQWSINIGFWLDALGGERPERVEQTHLYFRLERLVPEYHATITLAGALGEPDQPSAYEQLLRLLHGTIGSELRQLGSESGLRQVMAQGRLTQGLVRKEAREWLSAHSATDST
jgi:hypothetical protein